MIRPLEWNELPGNFTLQVDEISTGNHYMVIAIERSSGKGNYIITIGDGRKFHSNDFYKDFKSAGTGSLSIEE